MTWNPLRLLTTMTTVATWLIGVGALAVLIANLLAAGWLPGGGGGPGCVGTGGYHGPLQDGARLTAGGDSVCVDSPGVTQRLADVGDQLPPVLFMFGAVWLALRFLRTAAQDGPYDATIPGKLTTLGWFLLAGGPSAMLLAAVASAALRADLLADAPASGWLGQWWSTMPWWSVVAGLTALLFAHILRIGVRMREDLEGTI
ncbi:DUF2975 domain-containing protein [Amycolatopsis suaedae]|uniref:DUF2975 domain-containing protein n=1 Tax=Amycolatopsis suaedae TaxID=2510978 RepID=A0A4Q7J0V2_9PSEU|nr:DUF2975 domain-containing protein [Amycolatopsis suaedae]RZQ60202.1 DUF2975 domain-containing protein [Amycolatopsis suaedae]